MNPEYISQYNVSCDWQIVVLSEKQCINEPMEWPIWYKPRSVDTRKAQPDWPISTYCSRNKLIDNYVLLSRKQTQKHVQSNEAYTGRLGPYIALHGATIIKLVNNIDRAYETDSQINNKGPRFRNFLLHCLATLII